MWSNFITPAIGFLVTMVFGFWLSKYGKPYNGMLFNIHKLIALGTVVIAGTQFYGLLQLVEMRALTVVLVIVAALDVVALFISGAFLSIGKLSYKIMKTIHNTAVALVVIVMSIAFYRLP